MICDNIAPQTMLQVFKLTIDYEGKKIDATYRVEERRPKVGIRPEVNRDFYVTVMFNEPDVVINDELLYSKETSTGAITNYAMNLSMAHFSELMRIKYAIERNDMEDS